MKKSLKKNDDMYDKRDGIEFKLYRKKFTGGSLKFTIGWIRVEVVDGEIDKRIYNYPADANFENADNWAELILPSNK